MMRKILMLSMIGLFASIDIPAQEPQSVSTLPKAPYVKMQTVKEWQKAGRDFLFVDVREPREYVEGHLPGAVNIPYFDLEKRRAEIPLDKPVVFYCTVSSWRGPYAANLMADFGLNNTYVLEGGASAWNAGDQVIYAEDPNKKAQIVPKPSDVIIEFKHPPVREYKNKINLTPDQLKEFDGKNGRPAYVAINGIIYDVTVSRLWRGGEHDPSHGEASAGRDMTEVLKQSPHGNKHLRDFPIVGDLISPR